MKNQKICIIGGGLSGLVTAITLSKLNCKVDLVTGNINLNVKTNRTIAISQNNFNFLEKLNISKLLKKEVWPCKIMKLYSEDTNKNFSQILEFKNKSQKNKVLYMFQNKKIEKLMMNRIKKIKSISIIKNQKISKIENNGELKSIKFNKKNFKYNLIIICTGSNSSLVKNVFNDRKIENSYKEVSITGIIKHNLLKNNIVRQIFLDNEILALLPISNYKTSFVLSFKNQAREKNLFFENKIRLYAKKYLKNIKFENGIEKKELIYLIRTKYYQNRTLLFGDALHVIHPFVGQGFNMILRDLASLEKIIKKNLKLGLDIGKSDVLSEFTKEVKPNNFIFSLGVNFLKNTFSIKNTYFKEIRNKTLKILNKHDSLKDIFYNIADKGIKF